MITKKHKKHDDLVLNEKFGYPSWRCSCGAYLDRQQCVELGIRMPEDAQRVKKILGRILGI